MTAWLEAAMALIVAALVLVRWLGSHMRLVWLYGPRRRVAVTAAATVIRPLPAVQPLGIEPPRPVYGPGHEH